MTRTRRRRWDTSRNLVALALHFPEAALTNIRVRELLAVQAFTAGTAGPQEWVDLNEVRATAQALAAIGIGPEALPLCQIVLDALGTEVPDGSFTMGLAPDDLAVVRELVDSHDAQRAMATRGQYAEAVRRVLAASAVRPQPSKPA